METSGVDRWWSAIMFPYFELGSLIHLSLLKDRATAL